MVSLILSIIQVILNVALVIYTGKLSSEEKGRRKKRDNEIREYTKNDGDWISLLNDIPDEALGL